MLLSSWNVCVLVEYCSDLQHLLGFYARTADH